MSRIWVLAALAALAGCSNVAAGGGTPHERGRAAFDAGQPRVARIELMNALEREPGNAEARLLLARALLALGDGVGAESELARLRGDGVAEAELAHLFAEARLLQGDPRGAIDLAGRAAPPHAAEAARVRAAALAAAGDPAGAAAAFDEALRLDPANAAAWTELARFRRGNGDTAGAIEAADRAVAADPLLVEALVLRGELTRDQYGLAAAIPWFDRALGVDPSDRTALLERAATYGDLGRYRDLLADTRQVLALDADNALAFQLQAVLAARAGRYDLARSLHARTRGRLDGTPSGLLLAGALDHHAGNHEQAARRLGRLLEMQPGNRKVRRLLAAAQLAGGEPGAAAATLRPIAERADADTYSLALLGRALARQGDAAGAAHFLARAAEPQRTAASQDALPRPHPGEIDELRRSADAARGDAALQVRLISALLGRGLGAEALARARRLQQANPGAPDAHMLVGDALGALGDPAGAVEAYRRAANLAFSEPVALRLVGALDRAGRREAADGVLVLYLRENPRSLAGLALFAGRRMQTGDHAGAAAAYDDLRRRVGNRDSILLNNLAWAHGRAGDPARGVRYARRAFELDRDNPVTADTYGWMLFETGRKAEGLALLHRAARGAPGEAAIRARLDAAAAAQARQAP